MPISRLKVTLGRRHGKFRFELESDLVHDPAADKVEFAPVQLPDRTGAAGNRDFPRAAGAVGLLDVDVTRTVHPLERPTGDPLAIGRERSSSLRGRCAEKGDGAAAHLGRLIFARTPAIQRQNPQFSSGFVIELLVQQCLPIGRRAEVVDSFVDRLELLAAIVPGFEHWIRGRKAVCQRVEDLDFRVLPLVEHLPNVD